MRKYLLLIILFCIFSASKAQYLKQVSKIEYESYKLSSEEKDWITVVDGDVGLKVFRIKKSSLVEHDTLYYFKDYVVLIKNNEKVIFRSLHKDFFPMIYDDPYTIKFMETLITYRRWNTLYLNNRPEFAEKVMKFYNLDESRKKEIVR